MNGNCAEGTIWVGLDFKLGLGWILFWTCMLVAGYCIGCVWGCCVFVMLLLHRLEKG